MHTTVHTTFYGDIRVDYTDREYGELQRIKQQHYDNPDWQAPDITPPSTDPKIQISLHLPQSLRDRIGQYAERTGRSVSAVMRDAMEVLTCDSP